MAENDTNSIITQLAKNAEIPAHILFSKGFNSFSNFDVSHLPEKDIAKVVHVMNSYLRKSVQIAKDRREKKMARSPHLYRQLQNRPARPTKNDVEKAMLFARHDLLDEESGISSKTRKFIEDHCVCL